MICPLHYMKFTPDARARDRIFILSLYRDRIPKMMTSASGSKLHLHPGLLPYDEYSLEPPIVLRTRAQTKIYRRYFAFLII